MTPIIDIKDPGYLKRKSKEKPLEGSGIFDNDGNELPGIPKGSDFIQTSSIPEENNPIQS